MFFIQGKQVVFISLSQIYFWSIKYLFFFLCFNVVLIISLILLSDDVTDKVSHHQAYSLTRHCHTSSLSIRLKFLDSLISSHCLPTQTKLPNHPFHWITPNATVVVATTCRRKKFSCGGYGWSERMAVTAEEGNTKEISLAAKLKLGQVPYFRCS